jgi:translation initiation factor IF-2
MMRPRGAKATGRGNLVVAADDGASAADDRSSRTPAAGVLTTAAINKIDKPDANPDKVAQWVCRPSAFSWSNGW